MKRIFSKIVIFICAVATTGILLGCAFMAAVAPETDPAFGFFISTISKAGPGQMLLLATFTGIFSVIAFYFIRRDLKAAAGE